jgi:hypothetical protein
MRFYGIGAAALTAAAVLSLGIGMTLARASGDTTSGAAIPNASCTSANPCLEEDNKSTGSGLTGTSKKGTGIVGNTSFLSTSSTNAKAGVLGQDLNLSDKFNAGVLGTSKSGFGILGVSTNGTAVFGKSTNNAGVTGSSAGGIGVIGSGIVGGVFGQAASASGFGIQGVGFQGVVAQNTTLGNSDALLATGFGGRLIRANNSRNVDVLTLDNDGFLDVNGEVFAEQGVIGRCHSCGGSAGVEGESSAGTPAVRGQALDSASISVVGVGGGGDIFQGLNSASTAVFNVSDGGNIVIAGEIFTSGTCNGGCTRTRRVQSYVPHESVPMSEDVGEAQLVDGHAYVPISADFANVIDRRTTYLVFITPEGNSRGVYVSDKSHGGFAVHENEGGHSTLAFSYRIVAKPYGEDETRLPMVNLKSEPRRTFVKMHTPARSTPKKMGFPMP